MGKSRAVERFLAEVNRDVPTSTLRTEAVAEIDRVQSLTIPSDAQKLALERALFNLSQGDKRPETAADDRARRINYVGAKLALIDSGNPSLYDRVTDYVMTHDVFGNSVRDIPETPIEKVPELADKAKRSLSELADSGSNTILWGLALFIAIKALSK